MDDRRKGSEGLGTERVCCGVDGGSGLQGLCAEWVRVILGQARCIFWEKVTGWKYDWLIGYFVAVGIGEENTWEPIGKRDAVVG